MDTMDKMKRILRGYGINARRLAEITGFGHTKCYGLLADPGRLTINDLSMICRRGKVPADELREGIRL